MNVAVGCTVCTSDNINGVSNIAVGLSSLEILQVQAQMQLWGHNLYSLWGSAGIIP